MLSICAVGAAYLTSLVDTQPWFTVGGLVNLVVALTALVTAITALVKVFVHDPVVKEAKEALNGGSMPNGIDKPH